MKRRVARAPIELLLKLRLHDPDADPSTPSVIKEAYPTLALGLDTISEKGTTPLLASSFPAGGKIVTLLPVTDKLPEGVTAEMTLVCELHPLSFI